MLDNKRSCYLNFKNGEALIFDRHWVYQVIEQANGIMMDLKCEESIISVFPLGGNQTEKRALTWREVYLSHTCRLWSRLGKVNDLSKQIDPCKWHYSNSEYFTLFVNCFCWTSFPTHFINMHYLWHWYLIVCERKRTGDVRELVLMWAQSFLTLCDPRDCSRPGSSVHGTFQARILEWVAISFSRRSSQPRDQSCISCISCISRQIL